MSLRLNTRISGFDVGSMTGRWMGAVSDGFVDRASEICDSGRFGNGSCVTISFCMLFTVKTFAV